MDAKDAYPKAKEYVSKALDLDPNIPEAHNSLGFLYESYYYDFAGARSEFEHALSLNPSSPQAHQWYAINLAIAQDLPAAVEELKKAQELDPLSPQIGNLLGGFYAYMDKDEDALKAWNDALLHNPDTTTIYINRALFYARRSMKDLALADIKKLLRVSWEPAEMKCITGYVYAVLGEREAALKILSEVEGRASQAFVSPFYLGVLYIGLGDFDKALACIEKSLIEKSAEMETLLNDPVFERVRADPQISSILDKMGVKKGVQRSDIDLPRVVVQT